MRRDVRYILVFVAGAGAWLSGAPVARSAWAHGGFHGRVERASLEVARRPASADAVLARAALYRDHGEWARSLADLDLAARLEPERPEIHLLRGRVLLEADEPEAALRAVDRFLAAAPEHPEGRACRARALLALGRPREAAAEWTRAIAHQPVPVPERYLARARALAVAPKPRLDEAIRGLDEGLAVLGSSVPLSLYAVELEVRLGRFDAALARLDGLAAGQARQEAWLLRRGEVLERAGRGREARTAYEGALAAIEALPAHRRRTPALRGLEAEVAEALARVGAQASLPPDGGRARHTDGRSRP